MSGDALDLLTRELARQKAARQAAERLLEEKSLELFQRNLELEREIIERERIEATLREQAAALSKVNAELEQFAYVASHDLKAPLRTVASFAQLLMRRHAQRLDGEAAEFLGFIDAGVRRMYSMIEALLEYARTSRLPLRSTWVDSTALVDAVLDSLRTPVEASRAQIHRAALPALWGDPVLLHLLLQNLIENAFKFQPAGQVPEVRISGGEQDQSSWISVADNGIGIPVADHQRIFALFQRLHGDERYEGTGLGLSICRKIAERHGGTLEVLAAEGPGSRFLLRLPRPQGAGAAETDPRR